MPTVHDKIVTRREMGRVCRPPAWVAPTLAALLYLASPIHAQTAAPNANAPEPLPPPHREAIPVSPNSPPPPTSAARPVTSADVVAMHQSGLDDQVIINLIRQNGAASRLSTTDLISLRQHGVSNAVISAMQSATPSPVVRQAPQVVRTSPAPLVKVYRSPPPVVVHRYPVYRRVYYPHYSVHVRKPAYRRGPPRRSGASIGFGFTIR